MTSYVREYPPSDRFYIQFSDGFHIYFILFILHQMNVTISRLSPKQYVGNLAGFILSR